MLTKKIMSRYLFPISGWISGAWASTNVWIIRLLLTPRESTMTPFLVIKC